MLARTPPEALAEADGRLAVEALSVSYRGVPALIDVTWTAPATGLTAIVGPNGAGKSTLIKAVLDLIPRAAGTIRVFGQPYADVRRRVGYVPHRTSVDWDFPTDALDVVLMGTYGKLGWIRRPGRAEVATALACLDQVGMADFARRQISQLSGGQQQRVFLARALAQDADLYLMDEPFVGVDATTERSIVELLHALKAQGRTVLCVHHDLDSAPDYFDHLVLLNVRLIADGPFAAAFTQANLMKAYGGRTHAFKHGA